MPSSTARIITERPGRYGKQLISHLTRRSPGEWDDETGRGWLTLTLGQATLTAEEGALLVVVDGTDIDQLESVVGRHLVRFGARDELVATWVRDDGSPGGEQRNDGNHAGEGRSIDPRERDDNDA